MVVVVWLGPVMASAAGPPQSGGDTQASPAAMREFDIPSQPLDSALQIFGEMTGLAVLIDSRLLAGIESSPVLGRYWQGEALQLMLVGTGLAPRYVKDGAFTLVPADLAVEGAGTPPGAPASVPATTAAATVRAKGARIIQKSLEQALCASSLARPGGYRAGVRFWLDERGQIRQPELFESSGDDQRDAEILRRLAGLPLRGLPRGLPQPVMMLLMPESETSTLPCMGSR